MKVGTICQRMVFTVQRSDEVTAAARVMRDKHVGYLVVLESDPSGLPRPIGVLTDRDLVVALLASEVNPRAVSVGDIMTPNPITVSEAESMETALQKMREFGVRRLPVVNEAGNLAGVVATDDILRVIAGDTADIVGAVARERSVEGVRRP
jgi:CBS domain-containing protein